MQHALNLVFLFVLFIPTILVSFLSRPRRRRANLLFLAAVVPSIFYLTACGGVAWIADFTHVEPLIVGSITAAIAFGLPSALGNAVIAMVEVAGKLVEDYKADASASNLDKVKAAAQDVQTNLSGLISVIDPNLKTSSHIKELVTLALNQLEAWLTAIPLFHPSTPAGARLSVTKPMTRKEYQTAHDSIVAAGTAAGNVPPQPGPA